MRRCVRGVSVAVASCWFALSACGALAPSTRSLGRGETGRDAVAPGLRLPTGVQPLAYTLELSVLPNRPRFTGRTQISVELREPSQRILLHGQDLHVTEVRALVDGAAISGSYRQENADGLASLRFERELPAGRHLLQLRYDAAFDRQLQGLYRVDTNAESYAFTQFEALSARRAFPCFDEPSFKTPFDVWLTVPADDKVVANTQAVGEEKRGPYKRVHFAQTKPLPTYLVAWAVGPLDIVDAGFVQPNSVRSAPVPLRGIATKGRGALLLTALKTLGPILTALENYTQFAYPFDKLDVVAVPDFAAGAMENAGLVTFRDSLLLLDERLASEADRRRSFFVIAHELAHQWFGDLVTMRFWDDVWLNEAFATWLEYRVASELRPDYKGDLELIQAAQDAMSSDSRITARMVRQPIESTHDILNAFDSITYSKGGGVIGMFEGFLGPGVFQRGLVAYLRDHAFGNASTEDLLRALSAASEREVTQPFLSFLTQPGVPLVQTQLVCEKGQPAQLKLRQSRYLPLGSEGNRDKTWEIPLCVRYESGSKLQKSCTLLRETEAVLELPGKSCPAWVMPNFDGAGYYRFSQAPSDMDQLLARGFEKLNARERYVLLQSLIAGFSAATGTVNQLLSALPVFAADDERAVALVPLTFLRYLREYWLARADLAPNARTLLALKLSGFVRNMYGASAQRLGVTARPGESNDAKLLRAQVLAGMCDLANDVATRDALARAGRQYLGLDSDGQLHPEAVPSELQDLSVRMLVEQGDDGTFESVYQRFKHTDDAIERGRYLVALASVRDARAPRALALMLDPQLRVNEVLVPLRRQLADYRTRAAAYAYFEQQFDQLARRVSPAAMGDTPWLSVSQCDEAQAPRIRAFFEPRIEKLPGGPRSLEGALEALGLCDALFKAQSSALDMFFARL